MNISILLEALQDFKIRINLYPWFISYRHPNFGYEEEFGNMIGPFADKSAKSGLDVQLGTIISFRHPQTMHHACGQGWKKMKEQEFLHFDK